MSKECRLTTIDNPYSPFDQFSQWFTFDNEKGYGTCAYLARVIDNSPSLSEEDDDEANEKAIDEILKYDIFGIYKKVYKNVGDETPKNS